MRLLEASDGVGGRVRTDEVDGFLLDRGFQVMEADSGGLEGWGGGGVHRGALRGCRIPSMFFSP